MTFTNPSPWKDFVDQALERRVDLVLVGSSEVANYNGGIAYGLAEEWEDLGAQEYATPVVPSLAYKTLSGAGDGTRYLGRGVTAATLPNQYVGEGVALIDGLMPGGLIGQAINGDLYAAITTGDSGTANASMLVLNDAANPLNFGTPGAVGTHPLGTADLRLHHSYLKLASGGGQFIMRTTNPIVVHDNAVQSGGSVNEIATLQHDFDIESTAADVFIATAITSVPETAISAHLTTRAEDTTRTTGFSIHPFYRAGGTTADDAFDASSGVIGNASQGFFDFWFDRFTELQGVAKSQTLVAFAFVFGINDRVTPSTKAEYKADLEAGIAKIRAGFATWGGSQSNLRILLVPSYPHGTAPENQLPFYEAADEIAAGDSLVSSFNSYAWNDETEMETAGYYNGTDKAHLSLTGNAAWAAALLDPPEATSALKPGKVAGELIDETPTGDLVTMNPKKLSFSTTQNDTIRFAIEGVQISGQDLPADAAFRFVGKLEGGVSTMEAEPALVNLGKDLEVTVPKEQNDTVGVWQYQIEMIEADADSTTTTLFEGDLTVKADRAVPAASSSGA